MIKLNIGIIGAGVTGLAAAARLSAQGHDVVLYEKNEQVGGRMSQFQSKGYTFDMGPTIVMMPEIYRDVFKYAHKSIDDYLDMKQLAHIYDVYFSKDDKVTVPTDLAELQHTLETLEPGSTHGFMSFLTDIYKRYEIARKHFLERTFRKPSDFFNLHTLYQGMRLKTFNNASDLISDYVDNEKIQKLLAFQTLYIGSDPKRTPSLYTMIPMVEMMFGVHYIKGGMYQYTKALEQLNYDLGTEIITEAPIDEIIIDSRYKRAEGLKVNGDIKKFDKILCTADFPYAAQNLISEPNALKNYGSEKIEKMDYSCSAFLLYMGIDKDLSEDILIHNVIFSEGFDQNIEEIFKGKMPEDPSIYVYAPSVIDPSLAPEGKTGLYILMPISELKIGEMDWSNPETIEHTKQLIYDKLSTIDSLKDVREHIETEIAFTPQDFETRYNAKFGSAFGLMPTLAQSNYYRPPNVSWDYDNLYFAGASAHPGSGVPIVLTSAKITVEAMLEDIEQ